MSKSVDEIIADNLVDTKQGHINTEIQHPTDLIAMEPYFSLTMLLLKLDVLPADVHLMTSRYWDEYNV